MSWKWLVVVGAVVPGTACAPTVQVTRLDGTFEPRRSLADVAVFSTRTPTCPYQEIAIVTGYEGELGHLDDVLAAVKERALALGGDAVVGVRLVNRGGESPRDGYSGTAIRFTDTTCKH